MSYIGFGHNPQKGIILLYSDDSRQSIRCIQATEDELSNRERIFLDIDRSPVLYHWNDMIFLPKGSEVGTRVYCRGKDLIPFDGVKYAEQIRSAKEPNSRRFFTLQIQPSQICNDACVFCCTKDYRELAVYKGKRFTWPELRTIISQFAESGGEVVEIIGGGEPTLHPNFIQLLDLLEHFRMKAYLFTNGSQFGSLKGELNYPLLDRLARTCCILNVSLDGYRTRELIHTKLSRQKTQITLNGMRYIHSLRDRTRMGFYSSYILTGGDSQPSNIGDLEECVDQQADWVDSIHIQNDFISNSHLEFDIESTSRILQSVIDNYMSRIYIYYNYPLISRFNLKVPYELSVHNQPSTEFERCWRARLAPTVECGTNKVWPCGKYSGEGSVGDQRSFNSIDLQINDQLSSRDFKNGIFCNPCIHSSYNRSLLEIEKCLASDPSGDFYHFYGSEYVSRFVSKDLPPKHSAG